MEKQMPTILTFNELCLIEPQLGVLRDEAASHRAGNLSQFCACTAWYGYGKVKHENGLKTRLLKLVGCERIGTPNYLNTEDAYDVAYDTIYDALPDCGPKSWCQ